ncbi:MAG: 2-amino-4-hydroxy-6-hydroxymethyldihydropteridine diphosphokinase [Lentisphaerae bacterium GWF2_44_16]|nr:MAG: 2-amino-4-hydroxy-6-hydroxymethyldihydropteridine diphosphokinase [Lentisphaerae bacterium GWF2_44_16]
MKSEKIALSLGGNQGDIVSNFRAALKELAANGMTDIRVSSFYRTTAVACAEGTADFINAAATGLWPESPERLLGLCKKLESAAGRAPEHPRFSDRPLDIDIIFFGNAVFEKPGLIVPHPEAAERLFVLVPLAEIAGEWIFPGRKKSVSDLLEKFKNTEEYLSVISGNFNS